ncbi:MAG: LytTR family transcriptional regulator [Spirosomaceae bacterium]|nr:LytTR family transcriptional regulator [Spirosomataceae bacterium]
MKITATYHTKPASESLLTINSKTPIIKLGNIISIEAQANYSLIHTKGGSIICTKTLKFFEKNIQDPRFIRPHRSHIVNRDYIEKCTRQAGSFTIGLKNGNKIDVARRRNKEISDILV